MRIEDNLAVCTVSELAKHLAGQIRSKYGKIYRFPQDCDFAIIDKDEAVDGSLQGICSRAEGCWYGVKKVDTGFVNKSSDFVLISDYYGGECASLAQIWDDGSRTEQVAQDIEKMILNTLSFQESADAGTMLVVEFRVPQEPAGPQAMAAQPACGILPGAGL